MRVLSQLTETELFQELRKTASAEVREHAVRRYMPLARRAAHRFRGGIGSFDDRFQVASVGLLKAVDRFDPDRGLRFSTYAVPTISGELKRYARDHAWGLRVPRSTKELALEVDRVVTELTARDGESPTPARVAEEMSLPSEAVLEALEAARALVLESLDAPAGSDDDAATGADCIGAVDERYERVEARTSVAAAVRDLPERERRILELRFGADLSQSEIGRRVGLSQMHVSRLLRRTLDHLEPVA